MVLPLKLTQFYGSSVPRPRIYPDVKFSPQRVDPPPSVNDALLHWARQAHWSMGGLSFQRLRMQGKIEGSVRRLRAQKEKEARRKKSSLEQKHEPESDSGSDQSDLKAKPVVADSTPASRKRKRNEDEGTPVSGRLLHSEKEGDSPKFVPATEERKGAVSVASRRATRSVGGAHLLSTSPGIGSKKADLHRNPRSGSVTGSPGIVLASRERKRSNSASPLTITAEDAAAASPDATPRRAKSRRLVKKLSSEVVRSTPAARKMPARKIFLQDDSSDTDDPVESSPEKKRQLLRKSARLGLAARVEKRRSSSNSSSDSE